MDPASCVRSISVCESSSGSVPVKGDETSGSVSKHVLVEQQYGVGCCNVSAHAVHEEAAGAVAAASCHGAEKDTSTHVSGSVLGESDDASTKEKEEEFHVVDLSSCGGESDDNGQSICRICHFGSDQTPDRVSGKTVVTLELIEIGCKCKNELGLAHFHCAEAWFKLRGNSVCEICGCTAKNVPVSLTEEEEEEEWSEAAIIDTRLDDRRRSSRQSCCILLVIVLIIILLHWFFKRLNGH